MKPAVRKVFYRFSAPLEGVVPHMYADIKNLITVGVGNLIDPMALALDLPFRDANGKLASRLAIGAEWMRVKNDPKCAELGARYAKRLTVLRLDDADIERLVQKKLDEHDVILARRFPAWEAWPADAQLAIHALAWAVGPRFVFPRLQAALAQRDFDEAADECNISTKGNPGIVPRNLAMRLCLQNAEEVEAKDLDPARVYWPNRATVA